MGDILFLAHRVPYPPDRGDKIRSWNLLRAMTRLGRVHLATFADNGVDAAYAEALRPLVERLHVEERTISQPRALLRSLVQRVPASVAAFDSETMRAFVNRTLEEEPIDTIFVFSGQMAQFVPDDRPDLRFVMDFVDVDSAKFAAYAEASRRPMRWLYRREARTLYEYERQTAMHADLSLFVSDAETRLFRTFAGIGARDVRTLENGIDLAFFRPDADVAPLGADEAGEGPLIVFTGQMDYRPNIQAVTSFAADAFPQIRARHPDARFVIAGRNPSKAVLALEEQPGVLVTGAVVDIRAWLKAADVIVAPLRLARGVQNKVLEAMAMGKAVVASPAAFEGIDAQPGRDLLVADEAGEAEAVCSLIDDPERAKAIGLAARQLVEARYGWDARLAPLAEMLGREEAQRPDATAEAVT
jgi:sugar transferase (PEP-CTERM/EpsH1 system associated)